jgi:hypothetical protein
MRWDDNGFDLTLVDAIPTDVACSNETQQQLLGASANSGSGG